MGLIYYFSSQPSIQSVQTSNGVVLAIYKVYAFLFSNVISYDRFCELYFKPIRKLAHFSEFGMLGLFMYLNVKEYFKKHLILLSTLFSGLYAISDEIHQIFVAGRYCAIGDMLIDTSGSLCAILLIHLISKKCLKK